MRECGVPHPDDDGLVCRKALMGDAGYHGGGHLFAPPMMSRDQIHEGLRQILTRANVGPGDFTVHGLAEAASPEGTE